MLLICETETLQFCHFPVFLAKQVFNRSKKLSKQNSFNTVLNAILPVSSAAAEVKQMKCFWSHSVYQA